MRNSVVELLREGTMPNASINRTPRSAIHDYKGGAFRASAVDSGKNRTNMSRLIITDASGKSTSLGRTEIVTYSSLYGAKETQSRFVYDDAYDETSCLPLCKWHILEHWNVFDAARASGASDVVNVARKRLIRSTKKDQYPNQYMNLIEWQRVWLPYFGVEVDCDAGNGTEFWKRFSQGEWSDDDCCSFLRPLKEALKAGAQVILSFRVEAGEDGESTDHAMILTAVHCEEGEPDRCWFELFGPQENATSKWRITGSHFKPPGERVVEGTFETSGFGPQWNGASGSINGFVYEARREPY
jgi:hypothetical protein